MQANYDNPTGFMDLYASERQVFASYGLGEPLKPYQERVPGQLFHDCQFCTDDEFELIHEDVRYRVSRIPAVTGDEYVLRKVNSGLPTLADTTMPRHIVKSLIEPARMSGLLPVFGSFGQGKTTSAVALILDRLKLHGGVCATLEDPIEYEIGGEHNEARVYQIQLRENAPQIIRQSMRWSLSILFLGEIRSGEMAAEAMRAALMGTLVVCTIHAGSLEMGLERIYSMASSQFDNPDEASSLLAASLRGVLFQRLEGTPKKLHAEYLNMPDDADSLGVRSMIRARKFFQVVSEVDRQKKIALNSVRLG